MARAWTSASPWRNARWAPCWWRPAPSASARSRYTKTPNTWCAAWERFSKARLIGADAEFERWVAEVVGFVEDPSLGLNLPLDVRGTAFQRRV